MFEYANNGVLLLGGLSTFGLFLVTILTIGKAQHEGRKSYAAIWGAIGIAFSASMLIHEGVSSKESALASYEKFEKQEEIICSPLGDNYIVSKTRGWMRYNDGFTKEDLLINVRQCRVEE